MTTIVLADDHTLVRQGLKHLLEAEPGFDVVGEACSGLEAVELADRLRPDVLLVDMMMPGLNGARVARRVQETIPGTRVIVLSMHESEVYVLEALNAGASGYVLKDASVEDLVKAVREVTAGRRYLSARLSERAIDAYLSRSMETQADLYDRLSGREREVLFLLAEGLTNAEIGERLSLSARTVETHRASVMRKLGFQSQTDLIRYALRKGILPMDE